MKQEAPQQSSLSLLALNGTFHHFQQDPLDGQHFEQLKSSP
jgi:hypothetical protein